MEAPAGAPAAAQGGPDEDAKRALVAGALVVLAVCLAYLPTVDAAFVFDDEIDIVQTEAVHHLWPPAWLGATKRPLVTGTFALSWWLGGGTPGAFRALNIAIHAAAALLVLAVGRRVLRSARVGLGEAAATWTAAGAAAMWALHPLNTSAVTYVVHRYESLATVFYLGAIWASLRSREAPRPWRLWLVAAASAALGAITKEIIVTVPAVVLLVDATLSAGGWREALRARWPLHVGLVAALSPIALLSIQIAAPPSQQGGVTGMSRTAYLLSEPAAIAHYLRLVAWPAPLSIDYYDWPVVDSIAAWGAASWAVAALAVATAVGALRRSLVALPLAAMFIVLSPTSSIIPLSHELVAERRMYLPLAALALGAAYGVRALAARLALPRVAVAAGTVVVAGALAATTIARNVLYMSPTTLYAHDVAARPGNARAHGWYARYLADAGEIEAAAREVDEALRLDAGTNRIERVAGRIAMLRGRDGEAAHWARVALAREPDDDGAAHMAIAMFARAGELRDAVALLEQKMAARPADAKWPDWLAWYLATEPDVRDGARAVVTAERAVQLAGPGASRRYGETLAAAYAAAGRFPDAIAAVDRVLAEARAAGDEAGAKKLAAERAAYASGRPWSRADDKLAAGK